MDTPEAHTSPLARPPRTVAVVECGSAWTRALLFGPVEGKARLLARAEAPTMVAPPMCDLSLGARHALEGLEVAAGRRLFERGAVIIPERESGAGVDALGMALSLGGALRVLVAGPGLGPWESRLARAAVTIEMLVRPAEQGELGMELRALRDDTDWPVTEPPHVVLCFGPGEAALEDAQARAVFQRQIEALARSHAAATLVMVGGRAEQEQAREILAGREVIALDPVSTGQLGGLAATLGQLYERHVLREVAGFYAARDLLGNRIVAASAALGRVARFLAQRYSQPVQAFNVGASATLTAAASTRGTLRLSRAAGLGVRRGAGAVLRRAGASQISRWIAREIAPATLLEATLSRQLHPHFLPVTPLDLEIDHALAREALRLVLDEPTSATVLFGTGGIFAHAPHYGQAALLLLDAAQPRGPVLLVVDVAQAATALGCASLIDPTLAAEVVDLDALLAQLGTCFSAVGAPPPGTAAMQVTLEYDDGRRVTVEVAHGAIEVMPLAVGQVAHVTLAPAPGVDVGLGPGVQARIEQPVEGGRLGVIIDARGRPLTLPEDDAERRAKLRQWRLALGC